jgi:PST family polysaccharide transporter
MGKSNWLFGLAILEVLLNFLAFAISYRWGIFAFATATVVRAYLFFPIGQWAISRLMEDSLGKYLQVFVVPALCSVVMGSTVVAVRQGFSSSLHPLGLIVAGTLVGATAYGIAIRLLAPDLFEKIIEIAQIMIQASQKIKSEKP